MWALREPISAAIREAIISWQDLPEAGPSQAEREKELHQLNKDIDSLTEKIEQERTAAHKAGIELSQIHNRESVRKRTRLPDELQ